MKIWKLRSLLFALCIAGMPSPSLAVEGTLQFKSATYLVSESGGSVRILVSRIGGSDGAASVDYWTSEVGLPMVGMAEPGWDFLPTSGTLLWSNGEAADKYFDVPILDDWVEEGDEIFSVGLVRAIGASLGSPNSTWVTITENALGRVQFTSATHSVAENGGSVPICVSRTGGSYGAASVDCATANGTAFAGSDYTAVSTLLSWANGDAADKCFTVTILNDSVYEGGETFTLSLSAASGAGLGSPGTTTVTVTDDETPPRGTLQYRSATHSVAENGGSVSICVSRTGGSYGAASVDCATANGTAFAGSDYTAVSTLLSWANGDAADKCFTVTILNDSVYEGGETFTSSLSAASGAGLGSPGTTTVTVTDDDLISYALWTRGDTGQAALWRLDPVNNTLKGSAWLHTASGVGGPWKATSYEHASYTTGYVLWTRGDTGQAALWKVNPSIAGTIPITGSAYLHSPSGVGGPWQATSYEHVDDTTGYVLWTRGDTGQTALWKVNPSAVGTIPITGSGYLSSPAGIGGPWQATGYVH